jgi:putative transposase
VGRSENAVRIQVLSALISYLLVALSRQTNRLKQSRWDYLCLVRATLFQRPESEMPTYRRRRREALMISEMQGRLFP